jgi:hypothetical protein
MGVFLCNLQTQPFTAAADDAFAGCNSRCLTNLSTIKTRAATLQQSKGGTSNTGIKWHYKHGCNNEMCFTQMTNALFGSGWGRGVNTNRFPLHANVDTETCQYHPARAQTIKKHLRTQRLMNSCFAHPYKNNQTATCTLCTRLRFQSSALSMLP